MNILIVEDDQNKLQHLNNFIKENYPDAKVIGEKSYHSGLKEVVSNSYDIVVMDMSMPTYDVKFGESSGRFRPYAGREILLQMRRKKINTSVIFVTGFETFGDGVEKKSIDELREQLKKLEGKKYIDTIYYNSALSEWKTRLKMAMDKVINPAI
jgi:DNA-binding LytR/AlgR family response regulator